MYQMKLSRSAQHEATRGFWCRVCETCYKSREGYSDKHGMERSRMDEFSRLRQETVGKRTMEVSRLEKRLSRLTQLLANPPEELPQAPERKRWSLAGWGQSDPKKLLEQTVVAWENDADVLRCPYCQQDFSQYTFRRHHCRTCGKVVCGDPATGCSTMLALNVATRKSYSPRSICKLLTIKLTLRFPLQKSQLPSIPSRSTYVCAKIATVHCSHKQIFKHHSSRKQSSASIVPTTTCSSSKEA